MKKGSLLILLLAFSIFTYSQQVARNYVLVEIATGTWCTYCPGASMGADDLITNGDPVAVIENHYNDAFETTDSKLRVISYYGISSFPTANFDGSYDVVVNGSHTESMYSVYKPIVDARIEVDADFTLNIFGSNSGDEYSTIVRLQNVGNYSGENISLRYTLTESEIEYSWQDQTVLNFTNRLMVPDFDGVDLSNYNLSELTDIEFDFTFNNAWNDQHCELVVFIQDDDTKEVLQTNKIALTGLYMPIEVNFDSDQTSGCAGDTINFTDLSVGQGTITYNWFFEGGTPETSTEQNPIVTYNDGGFFFVKLVASDDYSTDSLKVNNYITIYEIPSQPIVPAGESQVCTGGSYTYTVDFIPDAFEWEWELNPTDAGTLTNMYNEAILSAAEDWVGDFTLRVRALNDCGIGEWSEEFAGSVIQGPAYFELEGGGGFCVGSDGVEVTLNGSEVEISYELFLDEESTEILVDGDGSPISFGAQVDTGYYTVQAHSSNCTVEMLNTLHVYYFYAPGAPSQPVGDTLVCNDQTTLYSTEGVANAYDYLWQLNPESAGTIENNGVEASVVWNESFSGSANLTVLGINDCGEGITSDSLEITVDDCTGFDDNSTIQNVLIFPNPVKDKLTISSNELAGNSAKVLVFNHLGQLIIEKSLQTQVGENHFIINMDEHETGLYILRLLLDSEIVFTKKFIKK